MKAFIRAGNETTKNKHKLIGFEIVTMEDYKITIGKNR